MRCGRYFPRVRQTPEKPRSYYAYVYDHKEGEWVDRCTHAHRSPRTAGQCADRMLRRIQQRENRP